MLKTVLDHQKTTVKSENLPIGFGGVSLLRRSGVCLCGISNPANKPIILTEDFRIQGVVVATIPKESIWE